MKKLGLLIFLMGLTLSQGQEDKQLLLILPEAALQNINLASLLSRLSGVTGPRTFTFSNSAGSGEVASNVKDLLPNIPNIYPPIARVEHSAPLDPYAASLSASRGGISQNPSHIVDVPSHPNLGGSPGEPDNSPLRANRYDAVSRLPEGPQAEAILLIPAGDLGNLGELSGLTGLQRRKVPSLISAPSPSSVYNVPVQPSAPLDHTRRHEASYSTIPEVRAVSADEVARNHYSHAADSLNSNTRQVNQRTVILPIPQPSQGSGAAPASSGGLVAPQISFSAPDLTDQVQHSELIEEGDFAGRNPNYGPPAPPDPSQPTPSINYAPQYKSAAFGEQGDTIKSPTPLPETSVLEQPKSEPIAFPPPEKEIEPVIEFPAAPSPEAPRKREPEAKIPQAPSILPTSSFVLPVSVQTTPIPYEPPVIVETPIVPVEKPVAPIQRPPAPVEAPPAPIERPPAPIERPPAPIERPPAPIERPPAPIERPPAPIDRLIAPTESQTAPIRQRASVRSEGKAPAPPPPPPSVLIKQTPGKVTPRAGRQPNRAIPIPLKDGSSPPTENRVRQPAPILIKQAPAPPPVSTSLVREDRVLHAGRDQAGNLVKLLPKKGKRLHKPSAGPPGFIESSEEFVDLHRWCCFWAKHQQCSQNSDWMLTNCKKACSGTGCAGCLDEDQNCSFWQSEGQCNTNPSYMNFICRKSCGQCKLR